MPKRSVLSSTWLRAAMSPVLSRGRLSERRTGLPSVTCHIPIGTIRPALRRSPAQHRSGRRDQARRPRRADGSAMFVEGVRLFVVVLGTAAASGRARRSAARPRASAAMLGCLLGYVSGGILGRLLDRALGVVERRVDADLARAVRRRHARRDRRRHARARARAAVRAARSRPGSRSRSPVSPSWIMGWLGFRILGAAERRGARDARPVDPTARARAGVRRARRPARRLVGGHGRPAARRSRAPACSAAI